jgi:hypothetical protein
MGQKPITGSNPVISAITFKGKGEGRKGKVRTKLSALILIFESRRARDPTFTLRLSPFYLL